MCVRDVDPDVKYNNRAKFPTKVMILCTFGSVGRAYAPIFIPEKRITAAVYQRVVKEHLIPLIRANYEPGSYVLQLDGAPAHSARSTRAFLESEDIECGHAILRT